MADSIFARYQLEKHGWTEGVGLGKHENGIINPIKVYRKNNKDGVGHIPGSDLTKNWWDQAYNKTASQILVKITEDGTTVHKKETKEIEKNKTLLYARFVKGATLKSSEGITVEEAEEDSSESDNEKEQILPRLTDEEIFKICGGRTAHKAAKHGLKQNGKLQRIQEQERQFLESLNKESKSVENLCMSGTKRRQKDGKVAEELVISKAEEQVEAKNSREKDELHVKNKQSKAKDEIGSLVGEKAEGDELLVLTKKTKKKKCKEENEPNLNMDEVTENGKVKSNKKKKDLVQEDETTSGDIENVVYNEKKRKKKKRKRQYLEAEKELEKESQEIYEYDKRTEDVYSVRKKRKKNKLEAEYQSEKKKRKCKEIEDEAEMQQTETEENSRTDPMLDELQKEVKEGKKRKKKKKKKQDEGTEENGFIEDEQLSVEKTQPDKILCNKIKRRIRDEDMTKICHKKKVVFSPKLCTIYTFRQDENETSTPKKKKKTKKT